MDLALLVILGIVIVIAIIIYKSTAPKALEVLDKPVEIVPEATKKAPAKKPRAKPVPTKTVKAGTPSKTKKNEKLKFNSKG